MNDFSFCAAQINILVFGALFTDSCRSILYSFATFTVMNYKIEKECCTIFRKCKFMLILIFTRCVIRTESECYWCLYV